MPYTVEQHLLINGCSSFCVMLQAKDEGGSDVRNNHPNTNEQKISASNKPHSAVAVIKAFFSVRNGSWMLTTFVLGACSGVILGFLFWHLDNLGLFWVLGRVIGCNFQKHVMLYTVNRLNNEHCTFWNSRWHPAILNLPSWIQSMPSVLLDSGIISMFKTSWKLVQSFQS